LLAAGLFIKRMSDLTDTAPLPRHFHQALENLPEQVLAYAIRGPLFFGAAEKALSVLRRLNPDVRVVIVEMSAVQMLDMTALASLENLLHEYQRQNIGLILVGTSANVRLKLRHAGVHREGGRLAYRQNLPQARMKALQWLDLPAEQAVTETPDNGA